MLQFQYEPVIFYDGYSEIQKKALKAMFHIQCSSSSGFGARSQGKTALTVRQAYLTEFSCISCFYLLASLLFGDMTRIIYFSVTSVYMPSIKCDFVSKYAAKLDYPWKKNPPRLTNLGRGPNFSATKHIVHKSNK